MKISSRPLPFRAEIRGISRTAFPLPAFLFVSFCLNVPLPSLGDPIMVKGRDIEPMLKAEALAREAATRKRRHAQELSDALREAMRLNEDGSECVAFDPSRNACILTVSAFNQSLEGREFPVPDSLTDIPDDRYVEARRSAHMKMLLDAEFPMAAPIPAAARDSLDRIFQAEMEKRRAEFRENANDSALRSLYQARYPDLFQGKSQSTCKVLASSDSAFSDSLFRSDAAPAAPGQRSAFAPSPWQSLPCADLPPELAERVKAAPKGQSIGPIATPYGFVYVRVATRRKSPDIRFEDALPALTALKLAAGEEGSAREKRIASYYQANRGEFLSPDTALFRVWLLPGGKARRIGPDAAAMDTARVPPRTVLQSQLPARIREELDPVPARPGRLLGPLHSILGTWYFQALQVRPGGRPLALAECRSDIERILFGKSGPDKGEWALEQAQSKVDDIRKGLTVEYLLTRPVAASPADASSRPAPENTLRRSEDAWLHKQLVLRFIELADNARPQ